LRRKGILHLSEWNAQQSSRIGGETRARDADRNRARERARPLLRYWLKKVERAIVGGDLEPIDYFTAKELTNYPSANEGRCYAGEKRIASNIGRCERSARQSLKRMKDAGLLICRRGGPGRTASWFFTFQGLSIFEGVIPADRQYRGQHRQSSAGLDRKRTAAKPSEEDSPIEHEPPPTPAQAEPSGEHHRPAKDASGDPPLQGKIITGEITFSEFWLAAGQTGPEGFARTEWSRLSSEDRFAIRQRLERDGRLDLRRMYAGVWLRERMWTEPAEPRGRITDNRPPQIVVLDPYSSAWTVERERRIAAGEPVGFMDTEAKRGKGWTVRSHGAAPSSTT
jgi:hypothetical protein